jgi:translation initiation factor 1A
MYVKKKKPGKKKKHGQEEEQEEIRRVRLPRPPQVFGILEQRLGASRLRVKCLDGKSRVCIIPGKLRRRLWVREGDIVIVEPWEFGGDQKGNVVFKYSKSQVQFLRNKGYLKQIEETDEF